MSYPGAATVAGKQGGGGGGAGGYRHFRFFCASATGTRPRIKEASISDDGGLTLYPQSIGLMTSANTPSPLVVTSSSVNNPLTDDWEAFDGDDTGPSSWAPVTGTNEWDQVDLGAVNKKAPNYIKISYHSSTTVIAEGSLQASNTGAFSGEEVVLYSWTGETATLLEETF